MATDSEIIEVLETLSEIYNSEPTSFRGYQWALRDISKDRLEAAAEKAAQELKWMPRPSELRKFAIDAQIEESQPDTILAEFYAIEDDPQRRDYLSRIEEIAILCDRMGRGSRAEWLRTKAQRWILTAC